MYTTASGVGVGGTGVAVAGSGVAVAGTGVAVAGTGVAVAASALGVAVGSAFAQPISETTKSRTANVYRLFLSIFSS